jgi:hypothetical protein
MTECVIMRLEKAAIVRVLHDEPKFSEMFMSYLLSRNSRVEEDLVDQLFNSSEKMSKVPPPASQCGPAWLWFRLSQKTARFHNQKVLSAWETKRRPVCFHQMADTRQTVIRTLTPTGRASV